MPLSHHVEILKSLSALPVILRALTAGLTPEAARTRPRKGEWAAVEVVAHMADVDERSLERVRQMLGRDVPDLVAFDQAQLAIDERYLERDVTAEVDRYAESRAEHVALLRGLDDVSWSRLGRHQEHGVMSIELYESHIASEDVDHLAQLARLLNR